MKLSREHFVYIQNMCKSAIVDLAQKRIDDGKIVTTKMLDVIVDKMKIVLGEEFKSVSDIKLRELAVSYILENFGTKAFGVDNGFGG